jgi:hypothetical protein
MATGVDQVVPSPEAPCPDPSAMAQVGPAVQLIAGRMGAVTAPVAGAGR